MAVSFVVALALLSSTEQAAETPVGSFGSNPKQEEPAPTALLGISPPGEVSWGLHRQPALCAGQEGGFALLSLHLWEQELCRAVPAELVGAQPVPPAVLAVPHRGQGVPWAPCTINGKNGFYFLADLMSLKQLPSCV